MVVFGLEDRNKKRVFVVNNVPSSLGEEAFVDGVQVPNFKTSTFLGLADVFLGSKGNRSGGVVILNTSPPECSEQR